MENNVSKKDSFDDWTNSAKKDLLDYGANYSRGDYPRALYFLQQAAEKLLKAIAFNIRLATEDENSDISATIREKTGLQQKRPISFTHNFNSKLLEQLEPMLESPMIKASLPVFGLDLNNAKSQINAAKKVGYDKAPDKQKVHELTQFCDQLLSSAIKIREQSQAKVNDLFPSRDFNGVISKILSDEKLNETSKKVLGMVNEVVGPFQGGLPPLEELSAMLTDKNKPDLSRALSAPIELGPSVFCLMSMLLLYTILEPHEQDRFPTDKDVSNFVEDLPNIEKLISRCIETVHEI